MAFSEKLKAQVRKLSHHSCCLCKRLEVEIHHIVPQEEGGPDTFDNAAPLCPSCHETYGANPVKRKFITEARDNWYDICAKRYRSDADRIDELLRDVGFLKDQLIGPKLAETFAATVIRRLESEGVIRTSTKGGWPVSRLLERLGSAERTLSIPNVRSVDVTYALVFETEGYSLVHETEGDSNQDDLEFNRVRDEFLSKFGTFIARQYCAYLVHQLKMDWDRGVTDDDINRCLKLAFVGMVMLNNHEELATGETRLQVCFTEDGQLQVSVAPMPRKQ